VEGLEDTIDLSSGNSNALIDNVYADLFACGIEPNKDRTAAGTEFDRVVKKVSQSQ
jgi:hypothetical protein